MALKDLIGNIATIMAPTFADDELWDYHHVATDEHVDVQAFLKFKTDENDPMRGPTKRQKVPVVRVVNLPWVDGDCVGDMITSPDGSRYEVLDADTRASGWTDLFVGERNPPE